MAKFVNVASVMFPPPYADKGSDDARAWIVKMVDDKLKYLAGYGLDLVVFSETVESTGQRMHEAESLDNFDHFMNAYSTFARAEQCHVAGSVKLRDDKGVYNSIAFFDRTGAVEGVYRKTFLTRGEMEMGLTSGPGAQVFDTDIGRLGGAICFDLNYERLRHQYRALKPDILCFASAYHGGLMQGIWAYDCRSFFVSALPRMGGGTLDPFGVPLRLTDVYCNVARAKINLDRAMVHLDFNNRHFRDIELKYGEDVTISIPPNIGPALIYSNTDRFTAMDIVKEYDLELLDDYFASCINQNDGNR